jgi:NAD(P)-dependent dehydrogenase (short-subunit alcohol dehydrogenase family)
LSREHAARSRAQGTDGFRLDGRVALVTGAGRGIGRGCAHALAQAGAQVVAVSRTRSELERLGGVARPEVCDVTDSARVRELVAGLERLDVLVVAAGANLPEPLLEVRDEHLDALLALNVRAAFVTVQAAARRMVDAGGGSIVLISSQMGHVGAPRRSVYCTTKHAVEGLTKAAAVELAPSAVRVNAVAPTFVETPMTAPFLADAGFRADVERQIPLGRIGRVEDVTGAVVYLASDASALVTGASLRVDGGWTAQ